MTTTVDLANTADGMRWTAGQRIIVGLAIVLLLVMVGGFVWVGAEMEATIHDTDRLAQQLKDFHL